MAATNLYFTNLRIPTPNLVLFRSVLETLARATAMGAGSVGRSPQPYGTIPEEDPEDEKNNGHAASLELTSVGARSPGTTVSDATAADEDLWVVGNERVDLPQLCQLFLGDKGKFW